MPVHLAKVPVAIAIPAKITADTKKKTTGVFNVLRSTTEGAIAMVSAEISAVLQMIEPIAFP